MKLVIMDKTSFNIQKKIVEDLNQSFEKNIWIEQNKKEEKYLILFYNTYPRVKYKLIYLCNNSNK